MPNFSDDGLEKEYGKKSLRKRVSDANKELYWLPGLCIAFLLGALLMIPVIIWMVVPYVAQTMMDHAVFEFARCNISQATNDNFMLNLVGGIRESGPFPATVHFEEPVSLYWKGLQLGVLEMPDLSIKPGGSEVDLTTRVQITNITAMTESIRHIVWSEFFVWEIRGRISARALGFKLDGLQLVKFIKLRGINGMKEIYLKQFFLPGDLPSGKGIQLSIAADIVNPSPASLFIGDVYFTVYTLDARLGEVVIPNFAIEPGSNSLEMSGALHKIRSRNDAVVISNFFSNYIAGGETPVSVVGRGVRRDVPVKWLEDAIVGLKIQTTVKAAEKLDFLQTVQIGQVELTIDADHPNNATLSAPGVVAGFQMPFGDFSLNIEKVKLLIELLSMDGSGKMARIGSPWTSARGTLHDGSVETGLDNVPMQVYPGASLEFGVFCKEVLQARGVLPVAFRGTADVVANTKIGKFRISDVAFADSIQFQGLNGLQDANVQLLEIKLKRGTKDAIYIEAVIGCNFNSNIRFEFRGSVFTELFYKGVYIGRAMPQKLVLKPGYNVLVCEAIFEPRERTMGSAGALIAQAFAEGDPHIEVAVRGPKAGTNVPFLNQAIASIAMQTAVPGLKKSLLEGAWFQINYMKAIRYRTATAIFAVYNSFDLPITIVTLRVNFYYQGVQLGIVDENFGKDQLVHLPPGIVTRSPPVVAHFNLQLYGAKAFFGALTSKSKGFYVLAKCKLHVYVGGFPLELEYNQDNIFVQLGDPPAL